MSSIKIGYAVFSNYDDDDDDDDDDDNVACKVHCSQLKKQYKSFVAKMMYRENNIAPNT